MSGDPAVPTLDGKYELLELLGGGTATSVYRGRRIADGATVALKLLDSAMAINPAASGRFRREVEAGRLLNHPAIIKVFDAGIADDGTWYMAMELLPGSSLRELLRRERRLVPTRVMRVGTQVANALVEAHGRGIIHRDLTPETIFVGPGDQVKVIDFGLVKFTENDPVERSLTRKGMSIGSAQYMAPEAIAGSVVDARADLYALGIILFECLTGSHPFPTNNLMVLLKLHQTEVPPNLDGHPKLRGCPPALTELVARLLAKRPEDRPPSARAVLAMLVAEQGF